MSFRCRELRKSCTAEGLSAERAYLRRTLPAAIGRDLGETVRSDFTEIFRAGRIVAGTMLAAGSYAYATASLGGGVIPLDSSREEIAQAILKRLDSTEPASAARLPTWDDCASRLVDLYRDMLCGS